MYPKKGNSIVEWILYLKLPSIAIFHDKISGNYGLSISSIGQTRKFISYSKIEILKWYNAFFKIGIFLQFEKSFQILELIFGSQYYKVSCLNRFLKEFH